MLSSEPTRERSTSSTAGQNICCRAGVELWVKPFHNLRGSREKELVFFLDSKTNWTLLISAGISIGEQTVTQTISR